MRTKAKLAIGAALILTITAGAYTAHLMTEKEITWTWGLRAPNGRPGFVLAFNAPAWTWISGGPASALAKTILTDRTDLRLTGVIEHGIAAAPNGCPGRWLLAQVHALPDGSVFISGFCATQPELERARGNAFAMLATES
jgi:hypothetical protein